MKIFREKINFIIELGITPLLSFQQQHMVRSINSINLLITCTLAVVLFANIFSHDYTQFFTNLIIIFLVHLPIFIWNYKQHYQVAKIHLTVGSFALIIMNTLADYNEGVFSETENISYLTALVIVLLFERKLKLILYLLLTLLLFGLKVLKLMLMHNTLELLYFYTLINTSIVLVGIYGFTTFFKEKFLEDSASMQKLMRQLQLQNEEIGSQNEEIRAQNDQLNEQQNILDYQKNVLRSLIDALPIFVALLDKEGKYIIANQLYEHAFKIPMEQIEGNHYSKVLTPELIKNHQSLINQGLEGESSSFEEFTILPNEQIIYSRGKYVPIFNSNNEVQFLAVFVTDITDLKESEKKLAASNKIRDKLFSIISHDLRGPLGSLFSLIEIIQEDLLTEQELRVSFTSLTQSVMSVSQLLENLLQWSKSQLESQSIQPKTFSFSEVIDTNFSLFRNQAEQKQIQLLSDGADVLVFADKNTIDLVVRNLLSNALKFSNFNSKIEVIVEAKDKFANVSVKDYGTGIPNEILHNLLREELVSTQGTDKETGTGLGLLLCREFVEKNGGKLNIISQEGKGSTFSFTIPLAFANGE
ncbi:MAG: hypothetical protein OHK0057_25340 [Thermoflexibacter sp.]